MNQLRKLNVMNDIVNNLVTDIWVLCGKPCDCNDLVNFSFIAFASYFGHLAGQPQSSLGDHKMINRW